MNETVKRVELTYDKITCNVRGFFSSSDHDSANTYAEMLGMTTADC